jgi:CspA family cold shock protein
MQTGKIKFFNESKGYGFIKIEGTEEEVFVHITGLVDQVRQNDSVSFETKDGRKGLNAINVKVV